MEDKFPLEMVGDPWTIKERKNRAISVLKKVGLEDHLYKKPNQMLG